MHVDSKQIKQSGLFCFILRQSVFANNKNKWGNTE
jgi:hypothetical protein